MCSNYDVIVLFVGYCKSTETDMKANCTCTLIKGPKNIIIDTMTSWDGAKLKEAIEAQGLSCSAIDYVICTHGHSDHIGCNYLFQNAVHIVGFSISQHDNYSFHDFKTQPEFIIDEKLKVIATPGHTLQDVTVLVQNNEGVTAVTGDLFEREEDIMDASIWKSAGSDCEDSQERNRGEILKIADYIIPGHGAKFKNCYKFK